MNDTIELRLSPEEAALVEEVLRADLEDGLVERHHTRTADYKEHVVNRRIELLERLLGTIERARLQTPA